MKEQRFVSAIYPLDYDENVTDCSLWLKLLTRHYSHYEVLIDNEVIATGMDINVATVLVKALFEEYYNEREITISKVLEG